MTIATDQWREKTYTNKKHVLTIEGTQGAYCIIRPRKGASIPVDATPDRGRIARVQEIFSTVVAQTTVNKDHLTRLLQTMGTDDLITIALCAVNNSTEGIIGVKVESSGTTGYLMPLVVTSPSPADLSKDTHAQAEGRDFLKIITEVDPAQIDSLEGVAIEIWLEEMGYGWAGGSWIQQEG